MAIHSSIGEFDCGSEDWVSYTERLAQYFIANGIGTDADDKHKAILLSGCGASTYQLIRSLVAPAKPPEKTFAELVKVVQDHHQLRPSIIVQRFHFHNCTRQPGISVGEFVAQLRKLSEFCDSGETLNDMLRDCLVCGCNDDRPQCKFLVETTLSIDEALTLAKAMGTSVRQAKELKAPPLAVSAIPGNEPPTKRTSSQLQQPSNSYNCYHCGGKHSSAKCRFREFDCNYCGKKVTHS